ncbi:ABC transporter ATP-binding protein [Parablautia intestinalis]|uniref:ABC transporter ATP-binding protein n=1 Tax=Parablautia intestinalis TaxID=2320100 RepID=UPI00256F1C30|nr:ABC transporter ATP-binding protein [Parablautia intestinalis]
MKNNKKLFCRLVSFYQPYLGMFIADLVSALAVSGIALVLPLGVRYIADNLLEGGNAQPGSIGRAGFCLIALVLVQAACYYFWDYQGHYLGAKIERDMRGQMFRHCEKLSFSYYDEHTVGDLMSRITSDSLALAEFFHHVPEDILVNSVKFVGASVILFTINRQTTLIILTFLPFMLAYTLYFNKKMGVAMGQARESMSGINSQVEDSLLGIRVVQSFANEALEDEKFTRQNQRFLADRRLSYHSEAQLYCGMDTFAALIPIAVVVFGGLAIRKGAMSLSDLLAFLLYISYFTGPVQSLVNTSRLLQEGKSSFRRYIELMETEPAVQDGPDLVEMGNIKGKLEFRHVDFCYGGGEEVFHGLNLTVEAGEYVALVGASGVGKTTLCALIPRFYEPQKGQILLDGIPVEKLPLSTLRKSIGIVQQDVYLFHGTVAENIAYGRPDASREEIVAAAKQAGAHEFIEKLPGGYEADIGPHGVKLSGGQKQRLSIARVFLKDPAILIFDEATSALDTYSEKVVQHSLEQLAKQRTTLVIAHRLSTVLGAGCILVLDENGVCERGTHKELIARGGVYASLYKASMEL